MFLRVTGRVQIEAASLNSQGGGGTNYVEHTKVVVTVPYRDSQNHYIQRIPIEVPAISGNMVKHYHFRHFVNCLKQTNWKDKLTYDAARAYLGVRFHESQIRGGIIRSANGQEVRLEQNQEAEIIKNFADCDLHGYVIPVQDIQGRRESLCKFSFLIPVEEDVLSFVNINLSNIKSVIHNRIYLTSEGTISGGEQAQMIFKREYASSVYGFSANFDLEFCGVPLSNIRGRVIEQEERKERAKCAIKALLNLLVGDFGANRSRALPVFKPLVLVFAISKNPIPPLTHGYYKTFLQTSSQIIKAYQELNQEAVENIKIIIWYSPDYQMSLRQILGISEREDIDQKLEELNKKLEELNKKLKELFGSNNNNSNNNNLVLSNDFTTIWQKLKEFIESDDNWVIKNQQSEETAEAERDRGQRREEEQESAEQEEEQ